VPPGGAASAPPDDVQELRQQIVQTREQLGETVEQLAAKADVKARAQGKAAELAGRVRGHASRAQAQAAARAGTVRDQLAGNAAGVRRSAVDLGTAAKDQVSARVTPTWEATPEPARRAVAKGASTAREHRVPLAAAAGVLIVGLLMLRWWRKR
jgi:methylphosphotriester-DNA--protein-cysteine methyltransferase